MCRYCVEGSSGASVAGYINTRYPSNLPEDQLLPRIPGQCTKAKPKHFAPPHSPSRPEKAAAPTKILLPTEKPSLCKYKSLKPASGESLLLHIPASGNRPCSSDPEMRCTQRLVCVLLVAPVSSHCHRHCLWWCPHPGSHATWPAERPSSGEGRRTGVTW